METLIHRILILCNIYCLENEVIVTLPKQISTVLNSEKYKKSKISLVIVT